MTTPCDHLNLLTLMMEYRLIGFVLMVCAIPLSGFGQSEAALQRLLAHRTEEQVELMRVEAHYRYVGELFYYAGSFLIEESGALRSATEEEIAAIDLHAYDGVRLEEQRTGVYDHVLNKHVVLLPRTEFEQLLIERLSQADRAAYMEYRSKALHSPTTKTH